MEQSTIDKVSKVALMSGICSITIRPKSDQVWFTVDSLAETENVASAINGLFSETAKSHSDKKCRRTIDGLDFFGSYGDLIVTVNGWEKERPSTAMESEEKLTLSNTNTSEEWTPEDIIRPEG